MTAGSSGQNRWQTADSDVYAIAMQQQYSWLKLGALGYREGGFFVDDHHFAHDGKHAYDSMGEYPMPYRGPDNDRDAEYGREAWGVEPPQSQDVTDALHHILSKRTGPQTGNQDI